ncbi:iron-siderophore ABC transporter substrate-binding protein [Streptomyces harbinensis]|uniref:Iron complex transport system substrate-binding protein n=1 Tax=Streptomyces harbinensis TaxID=1176198 RepID=A0A1I6V9D0_9ACTN|nr:iron-siderophore ABC transporter substrate-binding protein [Streptomyces harbinensis]SFT10194.1 iron complex transport system substrate-binding protein [Streptomyces harbinensis]
MRHLPRVRLALLAVAALALPLAACGSDDDTAAPAAGQQETASDGAFPVTVPTAFGDITIEEEPQRVVALGWGDAETALALGVQPVGASDWLAFGGEGVGPWAEGLYDEAPELIGTMEPELERIAELDPDLILDLNSSGTQERYDMLERIAPTVGIPEGGQQYKISWREQVTMIATALGRAEAGEQLIADTEDAFAQAAADHPEFEGKTVVVSAVTSGGYGAYVQNSGRVDFVEALGFTNSPAVNELAGEDFSIPVSKERLDLLDADVTIVTPIGVPPTDISEDPLYQAIPSVADGRGLVLDDPEISLAFATNTVLSLPYALDLVVPLLSDAVAGNA